jgi:hypothetical protein
MFLIHHIASGQISDTVANAIKALLLNDQVSDKIFIRFEQPNPGRYLLPSGTYSFICPDTTFQKVYKGILDEFPHTIATGSLLSKRKFYGDSDRAIYINGTTDYTPYIIFKEISVSRESARIVFFTTSIRREEKYKENYVLVTGLLHRQNEKWEVRKCDVKRIDWVDYFRREYVKRRK